MCDYSLMVYENRLAKAGEDLITYRFDTSSVGLVDVANMQAIDAWRCKQQNSGIFLAIWREIFREAPPMVCAVCVPPGAELRLTLPARLQQKYGLSPAETGVFDQLSERVNNYRDAIRFRNGAVVLLQDIGSNVQVTVLSLERAVQRQPAYQSQRYAETDQYARR